MNLDKFLEKQIYRILFEQEEDVEQTAQRSRGASRKGVARVKKMAMAEGDPRQLMQNLQIGGVTGKDDIEKLFSLFRQAQKGADPMQEAYGAPSAHEHQTSKRKGVRVPYKEIPTKEARRYLEYTILGALNAGYVKFDEGVAKGGDLDGIQVEGLGSDILIYFSPKKNSWHVKS